MELIIKLTEENLKSNIVLQAVKQMLQANTTINIDSQKENKAISAPNFEFEDITPPQQQNSLKSNENTQKQGSKTKEERVKQLCDFANGKWKSLNEKEQKSLKAFVEFYKKKIMEQNFTINYEKQLKNWFERDKNLK